MGMIAPIPWLLIYSIRQTMSIAHSVHARKTTMLCADEGRFALEIATYGKRACGRPRFAHTERKEKSQHIY